jgi:hypothetical protein
MSVIKSKRKTSAVQFLETARDIELHSLKQITKFKNKYKKFGDLILEIVFKFFNCVKEGNSIYTDTKEKIAERTRYFDLSMRQLYSLISQVDIAKELNVGDISSYGWQHWMELIDNELQLLKLVKASDKEKLKEISKT